MGGPRSEQAPGAPPGRGPRAERARGGPWRATAVGDCAAGGGPSAPACVRVSWVGGSPRAVLLLPRVRAAAAQSPTDRCLRRGKRARARAGVCVCVCGRVSGDLGHAVSLALLGEELPRSGRLPRRRAGGAGGSRGSGTAARSPGRRPRGARAALPAAAPRAPPDKTLIGKFVAPLRRGGLAPTRDRRHPRAL